MSAWKDLDLRWKALVYLAVTLIPAISGGTWLILNNMYWLEVKNSVSGLMNFVDAKQQGVIRFLGQNEKFAKELVVLVDKAPAGSVGDYFRAVVETDVFKEEEHPFKAEIRAGKRKIPTWQVYRAIDYVEDGVVKVSSDPARVGLSLDSEPDARVGYSDVHMHNGVPEIAFRAKSANGEVIVHADARVLTNIVNGEIGNLEGDMGAFYLAGVGKTFDYYMTNTDNVLITESRVHPDALLRLKGSDFPWQRTLHGANDPACKNGVYETDARVMTGCREAMGFYESQNGKLMLGVSMPFYDSNWTIVVEQEADEILGPLFSLRNRIIVATVVVLSLIVALSYVVLKRLMGRIDRVGGVVAAVAGGNLSVPEIPIDSRDEIGRIAENVNRMLNNLRSLVSNIRSSSGSVDNAATRLAAVTEETTHGVVQQQQEIEQVATAMNEMSATVQEVARNAMEAAESANATAGQTAEGNRIVSQTMDAINALANEIDNATDVIHELEAESNNIGTILDVIRGIAEQTNLLALNAAIEAARAGEQGRGFAVVADEVRTLAGRTQESTREIQEKIERLQAGTVQAVAAMQNSSQQAEASVQHAASAKESLDAITSSIDTINGRNTQIATAAEEQSHVAEEINKNVTNISQVAERNANGAQQVADSSDELTGLSHELQGMVKRFRL